MEVLREQSHCLHQECLCKFKSLMLKVHLSRIHTPNQQPGTDRPVRFSCLSCGFAESCSENEFLTHLHSAHLKVNHRIRCPYKDCNFANFKAVFVPLSKGTRVKYTKNRTGRGLSQKSLVMIL